MMSLFDWLRAEMVRIATPKFHLVDGPASEELRAAIESAQVPMPPSYKQFIGLFGNARLYRQGSVYLVEVFAAPREAEAPDGERLLQFGKTDIATAYFKASLLRNREESPVFEWRHGQGLRVSAKSFAEWLQAACKKARKRFKKREWRAIEAGPAPFTSEEEAIVEAREAYQWRVIGISADGDLQFEVYNGTSITLPYLTLGIRGKMRSPNTGQMDGGIWLPVASVPPGQRCVIEFDCYKDLVEPAGVDVYDRPRPGPEDRETYWEFRLLQHTPQRGHQ